MSTDSDFFRDVFDEQRESTVDSKPSPRGMLDDGLVRTTGWLQVGGRRISSGLVAAAVGLLVAVVAAVVLLPRAPAVSGACVVGVPLCCYALWWLTVRGLAPASVARTVGTRPAGALVAGQWVRLYGGYGPVGQVAGMTVRDETVVVELVGGATRSWPATHEVHLAELG